MAAFMYRMIVGLVFIYSRLLGYGYAQGSDEIKTKMYIQEKEKQVRMIADEIIKLDRNRCDLINNCVCSRHACTPIGSIHDKSSYNFTCLASPPDFSCPYSAGDDYGCKSYKENYAMSYVRIPIDVNLLPNEMCSTICMTKDLDGMFKTLPSNQKDEAFYFGSIEGILRIYPGQELANNVCYEYDPRRRHWYNGAISIQKNVVILIDHSYTTSAYSIKSYKGEPLYPINASIKIVREVLKTFSPKDVISVILFDESTSNIMSPSMICIGDQRELMPQIEELMQSLDTISSTKETLQPNSKGFYSGILTISDHIASDNNHSKICLLFTDGNDGFSSTLDAPLIKNVSQVLKNNSVILMIYCFDECDKLQNLQKEAQGYVQTVVVNSNWENPLYQVRNYFNFVALARNASKGDTPFWSKFYKDYEGFGYVTAVSYPVISEKNQLIGVAAIDVDLKSQYNNLAIYLGQRIGERPVYPNATLDGRNLEESDTCSLQCGEKNPLCQRSNSLTFDDLGCCQSCKSHNHKIIKDIIISITLAGPCIVILVSGYFVYQKKCRKTKIDQEQTIKLRSDVGEGVYAL